MNTLRTFVALLTILTACFPFDQAEARVRLGKIDPAKNINLPNWTGGTTNLTLSLLTCITSIDASGPVPYKIKVHDQAAPANPYALDGGALGTIPAIWQFNDLLNPGYENLSPDVYTAQNKTGSTCTGGAAAPDNAEILMTIQAADLNMAFGGAYSTRFVVDVVGGNGGTETRTSFVTVNLTVTPLIRIFDLNDITFPLFTGANLVASDTVCVYRNGPGTYSLTPTGSGAGGAFSLSFGPSTMPYSAAWNDGAINSPLTPNTLLPGQLNATVTNTTCANATLTLTILATDMNTATYGNYSGTLTLIVAPE